MLRFRCKCIGALPNQKHCAFNAIAGLSDSLFNLFEQAMSIIKSSSPVLITGESGTGKELFARALHYGCGSERYKAPFISKNSVDISKGLFLDEMFDDRNLLPGALSSSKKILRSPKKNLFDLVDQGTLFLDEIGDISSDMQISLLRLFEEHKAYSYDKLNKRNVNVRLISTTNQNIEYLVEQGKFRKDLYYRLSVFKLYIPPLRERKADIISIAFQILDYLANKNNVAHYRLTLQAMEKLASYSWPGNVRELDNVLTRAVFSLPVGQNIIQDINLEKMHEPYQDFSTRSDFAFFRDNVSNYGHRLKPMKEVEKEMITHALMQLRGNRNQVAKMLGISRNTLYRKIEQYNIRY